MNVADVVVTPILPEWKVAYEAWSGAYPEDTESIGHIALAAFRAGWDARGEIAQSAEQKAP